MQAEPAGNTQQPDAQEPQAQTCTISIDCSTILDNMDKLERGKEGLIPSDGILLAKTEVQYEEGDTVFTILKRELKSRKMHYDFEGSEARRTWQGFAISMNSTAEKTLWLGICCANGSSSPALAVGRL